MKELLSNRYTSRRGGAFCLRGLPDCFTGLCRPIAKSAS
jgi:hypothetical protein